MRRTFKYRIYANRETIGKTGEVLSLCRDVYNVCLEQRRDAWKLYKRSVSCHEQIKQLPQPHRGGTISLPSSSFKGN